MFYTFGVVDKKKKRCGILRSSLCVMTDTHFVFVFHTIRCVSQKLTMLRSIHLKIKFSIRLREKNKTTCKASEVYKQSGVRAMNVKCLYFSWVNGREGEQAKKRENNARTHANGKRTKFNVAFKQSTSSATLAIATHFVHWTC